MDKKLKNARENNKMTENNNKILNNSMQKREIEVPKITQIDFVRNLIENCKYDDALEQLEIMESLKPDDPEVLYELARLYFELGDYQNAIVNYERLLEVHQSAIMYFNLAMAYEANDETDKAVSNYLKCVSLNEKFPFAHKKLGILFLARNDKDSAIEFFENYLNSDVTESEKETIRKTLDRIKS